MAVNYRAPHAKSPPRLRAPLIRSAMFLHQIHIAQHAKLSKFNG
jgi:hypothetical protein